MSPLLLVGVAVADPLALRLPLEGEGVVVALGIPEASVAWRGERISISTGLRLPGSAVEAAVGRCLPLGDSEGGWEARGCWGVGLALPTVEPGLGVLLAPALAVGRSGGPLVGSLGLAAPGAVGLAPRRDLRLPLLLDGYLGWKAGGLQIGITGQAGPVWVPGHATATALQGGLAAAWSG